MSKINSTRLAHKQQGMTLMTTLIILIVMTVATTMSSKLSLFDSMLARNNKVKIMVYQQTANNLKQLAKIEKLHDPMSNNKFADLTGEYKMPAAEANEDTLEMITDVGFDQDNQLYDCEGFSGRATSLGSSARKCDLFDFQVVKHVKGLSGVKDRHHVGMGKEVPPTSKYSNL